MASGRTGTRGTRPTRPARAPRARYARAARAQPPATRQVPGKQMRHRRQADRWGIPGGRLKNVGACAKKLQKVLEVSGKFRNFAADIKPQDI